MSFRFHRLIGQPLHSPRPLGGHGQAQVPGETAPTPQQDAGPLSQEHNMMIAPPSGDAHVAPGCTLFSEPTRHAPFSVEQIARVCHDTNVSFCEVLGEPTSGRWNDAP